MFQRQLTANSPENPIDSITLSGDGKYLAYSDDSGISIEEIENGNIHRIQNTAGLEVQDWYPDGLHLLATDDSKNLWSLFGFSGEKHMLASQVTSAVMSRDGSQILLFRKQIPSELWTMPAAGGEPRLRISLDQGATFGLANWSPDGKSVVYIRFSKDFSSKVLEIRSFGEERARPLFTDKGLGLGGAGVVAWLPDNRILFDLYKGSVSESDLWSLTLGPTGAPVGKPSRITNTSGVVPLQTSVSRDGKRLVELLARVPFSTFVAGLNKAGDKLEHSMRLTNDSSTPEAWSIDGQSLFYLLWRGANLYRQHFTPDLTELFATGPFVHPAAISPDGSWLIASAITGEERKRQLLRIPISGGAPETIFQPAGEPSPRCAFYGMRICVLSELVGQQLVCSIRFADGSQNWIVSTQNLETAYGACLSMGQESLWWKISATTCRYST
jgi:hypothetical protein